MARKTRNPQPVVTASGTGTDTPLLALADAPPPIIGTGTDVPLLALPSALPAKTGSDVPPLALPIESGRRKVVAMGWQPDLPDIRDFDRRYRAGSRVLDEKKSVSVSDATLPSEINNRAWCSPIENQGALGSCTAQAVIGLVEYMMRRATLDHVNGSRLFVYKVTRNLLGWRGDTGAYLRTAMQAVSMFGVPPERYMPYNVSQFEEEPSAFLYSFADDYRTLNYTRLDRPDQTPEVLLDRVKRMLVGGYCSVFGFSVYSSLGNAADIPLPTAADSLQGGHAVMAVGYDDNHIVPGSSRGSLIIRNSWGTGWGDNGYGYLPYEYLLAGLARDFWTCLKVEWVNTKQFQ